MHINLLQSSEKESIQSFCIDYNEFQANWNNYSYKEKMKLLDYFENRLNTGVTSYYL